MSNYKLTPWTPQTYHIAPQLSLQPQYTPLQPQHTPLPVLTAGDLGAYKPSSQCKLPEAGFAAVNPPMSLFYKLHPEDYTKAFNSSGNIIGVNKEVPYPYENRLYHHLPFVRTVGWYRTNVVGEDEKVCVSDLVKKKLERSKTEAPKAQLAEYFTAENDEGYNQWASRKRQETEAKERALAHSREVGVVIKTLPGHFNPSTTETSNEAYGQYIDLRPKHPAVYPLPEKIPPMPLQVLVSFRPTNMSDHPRIPDHSFAVEPREMINKDGCYSRGVYGTVFYPQVSKGAGATPYTFTRSHHCLSAVVGERKPGCTWPLYSPTGLELNRPVTRRVSVIAGRGGKEAARLSVPPRCVPYIYNRYMTYSYPASNDPETEPNPALPTEKQTCAPCDPKVSALSRDNPCSLDFINPSILPVPVEVRKHPPCLR